MIFNNPGSILAIMLILYTSQLLADSSAGEKIYQGCKSCHGEHGEGGEAGRYPRIAGLPQAYTEQQLLSFKSSQRANKPMVPIFENPAFDKEAIRSVASYIAAMPSDTIEIPHYQPSPEILAQFESVAEFAEVGSDLYQDCVQCHGELGEGNPERNGPPLTKQYPSYNRKQLEDFAAGRRSHEFSETLFAELYADEIEALLAHIDRLDQDDPPG